MIPRELWPILSVLLLLYLVAVGLSVWGVRKIKRGVDERDHEVKQRMYELAILKEIADRTGYSLNVQKILDVIVGSLNQFLEYSAVSYMLLEPSKIIFKSDLEQSVSPQFIKTVRDRMISALSALLGRSLADLPVEETLTGAIMLDVIDAPVRSYFNIPLVIDDQLVGILTVAHTKAGLYKEEEMEILYKIIKQASSAVTKLEAVVKTEQSKIAAMLESMIEGVLMTDRDYHVIAANPAIKQIIGHTSENLPSMFDLMDTFKGVLDVKGKLEEAIKLNKVLTIDSVLFRGRFYQVLVYPVKSNTQLAGGEILGGVVVFHDVTHEKEAEKMRNDFTSMMVHELRSPLGNIKKIGELMRTSPVLDDKAARAEYVSMLYESSSSMLDLVNDLLDVAKLEAGKFDVDKQPTSIQEIAIERAKFFEEQARSAGITLASFIDSHLPLTIPADTKRITQVMNNLLSNGLNYTPKGGTVVLECFMHRGGTPIDKEAQTLEIPWTPSEAAYAATANIPESVVFAVTDTGEGISQEHVDKLFNKFTQFASSVRQPDHKGTGLGLVIVKGIIEAHGGTVGVGSQAGKGSTFYFTLPLV